MKKQNENNIKFCKNSMIIKGKTNGMVCFFLFIMIMMILTILNVKLYKSIPNQDATSLLAKIWAYYTMVYTFTFFFNILFFIKMAYSNICVTEKNVFGKTLLKKFDLTYNEISEIKLLPLNGIEINSKSRKYKIYFLKNQESIYTKINEKLN